MDIIDLDQPLTLEKLKEIITTENINSKGTDFNTFHTKSAAKIP
jgi:hypothetical protein